MSGRRRSVLLGAWFVAAAAFTALGGLRVLPPPFPQALLVALLLTLVGTYALRPSFRSWVDGLPSWSFLVLHLSRFVGFYFLFLHRRGELPYEFAVLGGWGDILVGTVALGLLVAFRGRLETESVPFQVWNLLGLADILFVVGTAGRLALASPGSMAAITYLPLGLLPTFLVPLILFTHGVVVLRGVRHARRAV